MNYKKEEHYLKEYQQFIKKIIITIKEKISLPQLVLLMGWLLFWYSFFTILQLTSIVTMFFSILYMVHKKINQVQERGVLSYLPTRTQEWLLQRSIFDILCDIWFQPSCYTYITAVIGPLIYQITPQDAVQIVKELDEDLQQKVLTKGVINLLPENIQNIMIPPQPLQMIEQCEDDYDSNEEDETNSTHYSQQQNQQDHSILMKEKEEIFPESEKKVQKEQNVKEDIHSEAIEDELKNRLNNSKLIKSFEKKKSIENMFKLFNKHSDSNQEYSKELQESGYKVKNEDLTDQNPLDFDEYRIVEKGEEEQSIILQGKDSSNEQQYQEEEIIQQKEEQQLEQKHQEKKVNKLNASDSEIQQTKELETKIEVYTKENKLQSKVLYSSQMDQNTINKNIQKIIRRRYSKKQQGLIQQIPPKISLQWDKLDEFEQNLQKLKPKPTSTKQIKIRPFFAVIQSLINFNIMAGQRIQNSKYIAHFFKLVAFGSFVAVLQYVAKRFNLKSLYQTLKGSSYVMFIYELCYLLSKKSMGQFLLKALHSIPKAIKM